MSQIEVLQSANVLFMFFPDFAAAAACNLTIEKPAGGPDALRQATAS